MNALSTLNSKLKNKFFYLPQLHPPDPQEEPLVVNSALLFFNGLNSSQSLPLHGQGAENLLQGP